MRRLAYAALSLTLSATLVACGTGTDDQPAGTAGPTGTETTTTSPTQEDPVDRSKLTPIPLPEDKRPDPGGGALPSGPVPEDVVAREDVQAAIAAEAERTGVGADQVEVVGYADVTWSDGSIGCPEPGQMYTMALVPGHQLILAVDGKKASYHAAKDKPFAYCANPTAPAPRQDM